MFVRPAPERAVAASVAVVALARCCCDGAGARDSGDARRLRGRGPL